MLDHVLTGTLPDWFKTFNIKGRNLSYLNPLGLGEVPKLALTFSNTLEDSPFYVTLTLEQDGNNKDYLIVDDYGSEVGYQVPEMFFRAFFKYLDIKVDFMVRVNEDDPLNFLFIDKEGKQLCESSFFIKDKEKVKEMVNYGLQTLLENVNEEYKIKG